MAGKARFFTSILFALGLALGFQAQSAAAPAKPCDIRVLLARLEAAFNSPSRPIEEIELPQPLEIALGKRDARGIHELLSASWQQAFDAKAFKKTLKALADGENPPETLLPELKLLRKRSNRIRQVFTALDERHEAPAEWLDFDKNLGKLNDALVFGESKQIRRRAEAVMKALQRLDFDQALGDFRPASKTSNIEHLAKTWDAIRESISRPDLEAGEFHEVRKNLKQLKVVLRLMQVVDPSPEIKAVTEYIDGIEARTGAIQDSLVQRSLRGEIDYENARVTITPELRTLVQRVGNVLDPRFAHRIAPDAKSPVQAAASLVRDAHGHAIPDKELRRFLEDLPRYELENGAAREKQVESLVRSVLKIQPHEAVTAQALQKGRSGEAEVYLIRSEGRPDSVLKVFSEPGALGQRRLASDLASTASVTESPNQALRALQIRSVGRVRDGPRDVPFLLMSKAPGTSFQAILESAAHDPAKRGDAQRAAESIGKALAEFQEAHSKPLDSEGARLAKERRDRHQDRITSAYQGLLDSLRTQGSISEAEARQLRASIENLADRYEALGIDRGTVAHGDLKPANVFFDPETSRSTLIDNDAMAETLGGTADPLEDLGRLYESIRRQGVAAGLPPEEIATIQDGLLQSYLARSGRTLSDIRVGLDFYRLRYGISYLTRKYGTLHRAEIARTLHGIVDGYGE